MEKDEAVKIIEKITKQLGQAAENLNCQCEYCQEVKPALELAIKAIEIMGCGCDLCLIHNDMKCPKLTKGKTNGKNIQ